MILHEFNVDTRPFSKKVLACLPQEGKNWKISQAEIQKRVDLRDRDVCSVDPIGCKDIDDALHCFGIGELDVVEKAAPQKSVRQFLFII